MKGENRKYLISILSVFMAFLIASMAAITVAQTSSFAGNLKVGDEMRWNWWTDYTDDPEHKVVIEAEVLEIQEDAILVNLKWTNYDGDEVTHEGEWDVWKVTEENEYTCLYPASLAQKDWNLKTTTFTHKGQDYKALHRKSEGTERSSELWIDYGTGIYLYEKVIYKGEIWRLLELDYTNADLTEATSSGGGGCLGTLFIALFSATVFVSYSFLRNWKKKKP